ncbi:MAG TPA: hypothetical protein VFC46_02605 [Humisphaera sp.]|nr:hypothetical protein [Humisphaera sp.]
MQAANPILIATFFTLIAMLGLPLGFAWAQRPSWPSRRLVYACRMNVGFPLQFRVRQAVASTALLPQRALPARRMLSTTFLACLRSDDPDPLRD